MSIISMMNFESEESFQMSRKNTARGHVDEIKNVQALTYFEANIILAVDTLSIFKSFRFRFLDKIMWGVQMKRERVSTFQISVVTE